MGEDLFADRADFGDAENTIPILALFDESLNDKELFATSFFVLEATEKDPVMIPT